MCVALEPQSESNRDDLDEHSNCKSKHISSIAKCGRVSESYCFSDRISNRTSANLFHLARQLRVPALLDDDPARVNRDVDQHRADRSHRHL